MTGGKGNRKQTGQKGKGKNVKKASASSDDWEDEEIVEEVIEESPQ